MTPETSPERIPAIVCVDVEPDPRDVDRTRREPWYGFEALQPTLSRFRSERAARTGAPVHFAWFFRMDPQVAETYGSPTWALSTYRRFVDDARERGDELGVHPHFYRWRTSPPGWVIDSGNQPWVEHCVRMSIGAFSDALGATCVSTRFGDHWMNDATVGLIEELGVRFDLTLEPGIPASEDPDPILPATGPLPDLTGVPPHPYRPARGDFRRPDPHRAGAVWMLPVTTRRLRPPLRQARRLYCRLAGLPFLTDVACLSLALRPTLFRHVLRGATADGGARPLVFVLRSDSGAEARERGRLAANLDYLLTDRAFRRLAFVTPCEAATMLGLD